MRERQPLSKDNQKLVYLYGACLYFKYCILIIQIIEQFRFAIECGLCMISQVTSIVRCYCSYAIFIIISHQIPSGIVLSYCYMQPQRAPFGSRPTHLRRHHGSRTKIAPCRNASYRSEKPSHKKLLVLPPIRPRSLSK